MSFFHYRDEMRDAPSISMRDASEDPKFNYKSFHFTEQTIIHKSHFINNCDRPTLNICRELQRMFVIFFGGGL